MASVPTPTPLPSGMAVANGMDAAQQANAVGVDPDAAVAAAEQGRVTPMTPATPSSDMAMMGEMDDQNAPGSGSGQDRMVYKGKDIAVAPPSGASNEGGLLSDVSSFAKASDKSALIGRMVKLTNVPVVSVLNPRAFYVGPSASQQIFVLLDPKMQPTANANVRLEQGKSVSLVGYVRAMPEASALQRQYQIGQTQYSTLQNESVYLHATIAQEK